MKSSRVQPLILALLNEEHVHLTAPEVYAQLKDRLPGLNPSTVYRALERLTATGEISVSDMGTGASVYEIVGQCPHHHLICQGCHKMLTLDNALIQSLFEKVEQESSYQLTTNHLVLFGYCPECQEKLQKGN